MCIRGEKVLEKSTRGRKPKGSIIVKEIVAESEKENLPKIIEILNNLIDFEQQQLQTVKKNICYQEKQLQALRKTINFREQNLDIMRNLLQNLQK